MSYLNQAQRLPMPTGERSHTPAAQVATAELETQDKVRANNIRYLAPERMLLYGIAVYLLVFAIAPVSVTVPIGLGAFCYLAIGYGCLLLGMMAAPWEGRSSIYKMTPSFIRGLLFASVFIGGIGMILRLYDRYGVRGVEVAANFMQAQQENMESGPTVYSTIAAVLYPFCYLVFFLYLVKNNGKGKKLGFISSLIMCLSPGLTALSMGSRSFMLVSGGMVIIFCVYFGILKFNTKTFLFAVGGTFLAAAFFTVIFVYRLKAMKVDPTFSVYSSVYAFTVRPNLSASSAFAQGSGLAYYLNFMLLSMTQYFIHGVFEFGYEFQHFLGNHTWGADNFAAYFKLFAMLMGARDPMDSVLAVSPRTGAFTTFFGPVYLDFGWYGMPLLIAFGFFIKKLWYRFVARDYLLAPLYAYFAVVLFLSPVVNLLVGAQGLYTITSFIVFWAVAAANRTTSSI
jgi:hypothetical protein